MVDNDGSFVGCRSWTLCWCVFTLYSDIWHARDADSMSGGLTSF